MAYTVQTAITNAQSIADVPNTSFFTASDALSSAQTCFEDLYALYCERGDDYFMTSYGFTSADFLPDSTRVFSFILPVPADFYRLTLLQFSGNTAGNQFLTAYKVSTLQYGNSNLTPHYRPVGQNPPAQKWANALQYVAVSTYNYGDKVYYRDSSSGTQNIYSSVTNGNTVNAPYATGTVNANWTIVSGVTTYLPGTIVYYSDPVTKSSGSYQCMAQTPGNFGVAPPNYTNPPPSPGNTQTWLVSSTYAQNDLVSFTDLTLGYAQVYISLVGANIGTTPSVNGVLSAKWAIAWIPLGANSGYLNIYDPVGYPNWTMWYYPKQRALTTSTDIQALFPNNIVPEIFVNQIAMDIRRKQKVDISAFKERRDELIKTLEKQLVRDENRAEAIKNEFTSGFSPYR